MWYRLSRIKGEYWLTDNGHLFADGDVGDDNHEMLAESHILGQLGNDIGDEDWGTQTMYNARNMFYDAVGDPNRYLGQMEEYIEGLQEQYGEDWADYADYENYLLWLNTRDITDENEKERITKWVAQEIKGAKDSRQYVSKQYDWVRVQGNNIEVWELNNLARLRIKRQMQDIYYEEGNESDDTDSWKEQPVFNLSILSTGQYIPNLSYYDLITPDEEKKKARENAYDFYPDYRTTQRQPTNIPGYQYSGG
jgi:hypothetical protein